MTLSIEPATGANHPTGCPRSYSAEAVRATPNAASLDGMRDLRKLNRLERAGWAALAAREFAISAGEASVLQMLVQSPGHGVDSERLSACLRQCGRAGPVAPAVMRLTVRISRIRGALEAAGVPRSAILAARDGCFSISPRYAKRVRQIVEGE